jgi:hypothetical protein
MADNVLDELKQALQQLSTLLDNTAVKTAIGLIPDSIMGPVIEGLKTILGVVKDALDELKASLDSVVNIEELLGVISSLLDAVEGLAPDQRSTLESVRAIVKTLQDIPGPADIDEMLGLIGQIITKLEAL